MSSTDYPDALKFSPWDKKKGSLPADADLGGLLKALQKRHDAVNWKLFDAGWPQQAKTAAELQEAFALRDRLGRGSLLPLKKDANEVATAAARLAKDKAAAKPALEAGKAIASAARAYADALDAAVDQLRTLHDKALASLPADDGDDEEPGSALLDPKRLLQQLKLCKRDPERRVQFGYVDGKDKQPAVLALSPKLTGRKLFTRLQHETGVKTGAFGSAWIDGSSLMLKLDKPLGGLVKKVRVPLKAAGFRIAKVVLWNEDGTVFEQDEDSEGSEHSEHSEHSEGAAAPADAPPATPAAASSDGEPAFTARLKALLPRLAAAATLPAGAAAKLQVSEAGAAARQRNWTQAGDLLDRAEALLASAPAVPSAAPAARAAAAPGRFVHQAKVRLGWQMARQKLSADLSALERAILDHYSTQPELADLAQRVRRFDTVLGTLDESLTDTLDAALNAADPGQRSALHEQARGILAGYTTYVRGEPLIAALDDNPFVPLTTHKTLLKTLQVLDNSLS